MKSSIAGNAGFPAMEFFREKNGCVIKECQ